jgi:hypothetical protein
MKAIKISDSMRRKHYRRARHAERIVTVLSIDPVAFAAERSIPSPEWPAKTVLKWFCKFGYLELKKLNAALTQCEEQYRRDNPKPPTEAESVKPEGPGTLPAVHGNKPGSEWRTMAEIWAAPHRLNQS